VRNLSLTTTKEDLVTYFSEIGPVKRGIIVSEKKSKGGASKGFGFVVFALESDAHEAIRVLGDKVGLCWVPPFHQRRTPQPQRPHMKTQKSSSSQHLRFAL